MTVAANNNLDFDTNGGYGLLAQSLGAITTTNLDAWGNGGYGAQLNNALAGSAATATITLNNPSTWDNNFNGNAGDGLDVYSNRAITITNLYTNSNSGAGAVLVNASSGTASPQTVTLNGQSEFYNNGDSGLVVASYGLITLNTITANNNGGNAGSFGWGAYMDNCGYVSGACTGAATTPQGVVLNGANDFENNYQDGLWITSKGAITVSNLTANGNGVDGAYLDNQWPSAVGGITLTGTNDFQNNSDIGLEVFSKGAINMNNVTPTSFCASASIRAMPCANSPTGARACRGRSTRRAPPSGRAAGSSAARASRRPSSCSRRRGAA